MTVTLSTTRQGFVRRSLAALLLGAGLLIGFAQPGAAGEIAAAHLSPPLPQTQHVSRSEPDTTPVQATPVHYSAPPAGTVGFGWG